jgi:hypothetical protein
VKSIISYHDFLLGVDLGVTFDLSLIVLNNWFQLAFLISLALLDHWLFEEVCNVEVVDVRSWWSSWERVKNVKILIWLMFRRYFSESCEVWVFSHLQKAMGFPWFKAS